MHFDGDNNEMQIKDEVNEFRFAKVHLPATVQEYLRSS